jgi:tetratricopeptide (TPR) repeat protein
VGRCLIFIGTEGFALEKMAASHYAELVRRLCEHMTSMFEQAERTWSTTPRADWLAKYEPELDSLRVALGWSLRPDGDPALGLKLVGYTLWLWRELSLVHEQRRWLELALTFVDNATRPSVEARIRLGLGWHFVGGYRGRFPHNLRAIELLRQVGGEPVLLGLALVQAGQATYWGGPYLDEALSVLRPSGRTKGLAMALLNAGVARRYAGDLGAARALIAEALALSKVLGDVRLQDMCELEFALIAFAAGQMAEAIDHARRAAEASRRHGILTAQLLALHYLAGLLVLDDQIEPGRAAALRAFEFARALGNVDLLFSIYPLALVLAVHGETDTAARLAGFADRYADQHQIERGPFDLAMRSRLVERLHSAMSPEECQAAMAAGAAWSEQEAIAAAEAA